MLKKLFSPEVYDICPNCGETCETSAILCPNCGKKLDELFEQLPDLEFTHKSYWLTKAQGCVIVFVMSMIVLSTACWIINSITNGYYQKFHEDDLSARKKLGELNAEVFAQLPPAPDGATLTEFFNNGGAGNSYYHGNYLFAEYNLDVTPEIVIAYYKEFFDRNGWEQYHYNDETLMVFRQTSCVRIEPSYTQYFHGFSIWIWHDYQKQSFSPILPPFLEISEVGETYVDRCP